MKRTERERWQLLDKEKSTPKSVTLSFLMNKIKRIQQDTHDRQDITSKRRKAHSFRCGMDSQKNT